jgi:cytochrome c5
MKHLQTSVLFIVAGAVLTFTGAMSVSRPLSAAERPAAKAMASAAPAAGDGALFVEFVSVLRHPRCMNCHSRGEFPRQGNDSHPHTMNVRRGPEGHGVTAENCSTCHQDHNLAGAHMPPGAPNWGLPPPITPMIWQDLSDGQICRSIKDPKQNKNRSLDQLVEHLTEDKLVAWGWNPGQAREPIPMSHDEFAAKVKKWRSAGAPCPADAGQKAAVGAPLTKGVPNGFRRQSTKRTLIHHWQGF